MPICQGRNIRHDRRSIMEARERASPNCDVKRLQLRDIISTVAPVCPVENELLISAVQHVSFFLQTHCREFLMRTGWHPDVQERRTSRKDQVAHHCLQSPRLHLHWRRSHHQRQRLGQ